MKRLIEKIEKERGNENDYTNPEGKKLVRHWNNCIDVILEIIQSNNNEEWILCKDRLPTKTDCLNYDDLRMEHFDCFWVTILQNCHGLTYTTRMCYSPERNLWYRNGSDMSGIDANKIIAWMPLNIPKPYRESDSN